MDSEKTDFYTKMLTDLPGQFKGKARIEGLCYAFSKQLDAVRSLYAELQYMRSIKNAVGRQLDGIGDIAVLTREEATVLAMKSAAFTHMTDDIYRLYLIQKIMANMTNCTYQEIYDAVFILFGNTPIRYSESIDEPATITMTVHESYSDKLATFLGFWDIRPAGVKFVFQIFIDIKTTGNARISSTMIPTVVYMVTNDFDASYEASGTAIGGATLVEIKTELITNDFNANYAAEGQICGGANAAAVTEIMISNDFEAVITAEGSALNGSTTVIVTEYEI